MVMPILHIKDFKGYSSKPDQEITDPSLLSVAEDVIIDKGDIVNFPYPINFRNWSGDITKTRLVSFYRIQDKVYLIYADTSEEFYMVLGDDIFNSLATGLGPGGVFIFIVMGFKQKNITHGNWQQFGEWIYAQADTQRMLRFRYDDTYQIGPVGIEAPLFVVQDDASQAGNIDGTFQFAFTFVTNIGKRIESNNGDSSEILHEVDIESNAVVEASSTIYSNKKAIYNIYLPLDHGNELFPYSNEGPDFGIEGSTGFKRVQIGVYARLRTESFYYFVGFYDIDETNVQVGLAGKKYVQVTIGDSNTLDSTTGRDTIHTAPLTGHSAPKHGFHSAFYKGQVYRTVAMGQRYTNVSTAGTFKRASYGLNELQVSPDFNELFTESRYAISSPSIAQKAAWLRVANYVDEQLSTPIGEQSERLSGLVEFLDQLVIWSDKRTYLLSGPIATGTLRKIFDIGCVNIEGGKSYISYNNEVFWLAEDGYYKWDGSQKPINISDAIREDLELIDKDRYKHSRASLDYRYNLILLSFPRVDHLYPNKTENYPTFIYHINTGIWTKLKAEHKVNQLLKYKDSSIIINPRSYLELGLIEDRFDVPTFPEVIFKPSIKTALIGKDKDIVKHWKMIKVVMNKNVLPALGISSKALGAIEQSKNSHRIYAGRYKNEIAIHINTFTFPIRLNSIEVDVHAVGRR